MKMKPIAVMIVLQCMLLAGCRKTPAGEYRTVRVKAVEQVENYTYLFVKGKGPAYWVAVPSMDASPGETYSYRGGLLMEEFYSKELDRTFEQVIFLEGLFSGEPPEQARKQEVDYKPKVAIEKSDVNLEQEKGFIPISDLYADPAAYEGQTIQVKGKVTRFNPEIMGRNWVHIQDGTDHNGKFDLTATSSASFETGSTVKLEGVVSLNKDFGYGYTYEILLEDAVPAE